MRRYEMKDDSIPIPNPASQHHDIVSPPTFSSQDTKRGCIREGTRSSGVIGAQRERQGWHGERRTQERNESSFRPRLSLNLLDCSARNPSRDSNLSCASCAAAEGRALSATCAIDE